MTDTPPSLLHAGLEQLVRTLDLRLEYGTHSQNAHLYRHEGERGMTTLSWWPAQAAPAATVDHRLPYKDGEDPHWLMLPARHHLGPREAVGDPDFDALVAVATGHAELRRQLSVSHRESLQRLVGQHGWVFRNRWARLPPDGVARLAAAGGLTESVQEATQLLADLAEPVSPSALIERWLGDDVAPIQDVVNQTVDRGLRGLTGNSLRHAVARIFAVPEQGMDRVERLPLTTDMVSAWCVHGSPLAAPLVARLARSRTRRGLLPATRLATLRMSEIIGFWTAHASSEVGGAEVVASVTKDMPLSAQFTHGLLAGVLDGASVSDSLVEMLLTLPVAEPDTRAALAILREHAEPSDLLDVLVSWRGSKEARKRESAVFAIPTLVHEVWVRQDEPLLARLRRWAEHDAAVVDRMFEERSPTVDAFLTTLRPEGEQVQRMLAARLAHVADAEEALIWLLTSSTVRVQTHAAQGLEAVGTGAALRPLQDAGAGWFLDAGFKRACQAAIVAIRQRGTRGAVSVADPGGQVSVPSERPASNPDDSA